MKNLSVAEVEYVAHRLARETMGWDEPIPDFMSRFPNILESCLAVPFQKFGGRHLYKGMIAKASILFYLMIKNHPFKNGIKNCDDRVVLFLHKNKKWMRVDNQELYNFAKWVAESNSKLKKETVAAVEKFISSYMENL